MARRTPEPAWIRSILARIDAGVEGPGGVIVHTRPSARAALRGALNMLECDEMSWDIAVIPVVHGDGSCGARFAVGTRRFEVICTGTTRLRVVRHDDRRHETYHDTADARNWVGRMRNTWSWFMGHDDPWAAHRPRSSAELAEEFCRDLAFGA